MCAATMLTTSCWCDPTVPVDDKMEAGPVVAVLHFRGRTTLVMLTIRASMSLFRFNISSLSRSCSRMNSSIRRSSASISFTIPGLCAETESCDADAVHKPDVVAGGLAAYICWTHCFDLKSSAASVELTSVCIGATALTRTCWKLSSCWVTGSRLSAGTGCTMVWCVTGGDDDGSDDDDDDDDDGGAGGVTTLDEITNGSGVEAVTPSCPAFTDSGFPSPTWMSNGITEGGFFTSDGTAAGNQQNQICNFSSYATSRRYISTNISNSSFMKKMTIILYLNNENKKHWHIYRYKTLVESK